MSKYHEYYDRLNAGKKDYAGEVARIMDLYKSIRGTSKLSRILEIGSGTGNHTIELAKIASKVWAVDIDPEMTKIAEEKLQAADGNVEFCQGVHHVHHSNFPLCVMMWHVLNYFPTLRVVESMFNMVYHKLEYGGCFFFDAWNGVAVLRDLPKSTKNKIEIDDLTIIHELNGSTSLMDQRTLILNKVEVLQDGKLIDSFSQEVIHYIWTPKIVKELLLRVGFESVEIVKTTDYSEPADEDDWKIFFIAKKMRIPF